MRTLGLGDRLDPKSRAPSGAFALEASDLTTHGTIVGMTGSGKTGLGIVLIEECLRAGISVLAIDPKGDLGNLLLLFPKLEAAEFEPWVDPDAASRAGGVGAEAERAAAAAREGLAKAGLGSADVAALAAAHEVRLYTPGSSAGSKLGLLASLEAPAKGTPDDEVRSSIATLAGSLLSLAGLDPDPVRSRDAVLVGRVIDAAWQAGKDLTLEGLIGGVATPPFDRLGALPLETAYPSRDRQALAQALNNLLASPVFAGFLEGEPLDIAAFFPKAGSKPRLTIVSIAHLGEAERLFVTAIVAERVRGWLRSQPGTSELRALFYLDEVLGFLPPHPRNPPPKAPLLALLKQARAFGLGVVLATQNPVDLDYKGLANMGTWMIGRLQTAQDQERLAEGLASAIRGQGGDADLALSLLGTLEKRVFLVQDVHRKGPELVRSRYAMSYLRGPLTRADLERLTASGARGASPVSAGGGGASTGKSAAGGASAAAGAAKPLVPSWLKERFLTRREAAFGRPHLLVKAAVRYKIVPGSVSEETLLRAFPLRGGTSAEVLEAEPVAVDEEALRDAPPADAGFDDLDLSPLTSRKDVEKAVRDRLPDRLATTVLYDARTKLVAHPGEEPAAFTERVKAALAGARGKGLADKLASKRLDLARATQEASSRTREKWTTLGTTVLSNVAGIFFGKKRTITGASSVLTKDRLEDSAEARVAKIQAEVASLEAEQKALDDVDASTFEERRMAPSKADVDVLRIELVWIW